MAEEFEPPKEIAKAEQAESGLVKLLENDSEDRPPTDQEVDAAALALNLTIFKFSGPIKGFRAKQLIGRHLRKLGIVDVGRGQLAVAESNITDCMMEIDDMIAATVDANVRMGLMALKVKLNEQLITIGQTSIKGTSAGGDGVVSPVRPNVAFPIGQPVQVNVVQANNSSKPEQK